MLRFSLNTEARERGAHTFAIDGAMDEKERERERGKPDPSKSRDE